MQTYAGRSTAVIVAGIAAGILVWAFVTLMGVELTLEAGAAMHTVGLFDVILASAVGGLAGWAVNAFLLRLERQRYWPPVATSALVISIMLGPSRLADGASAAALTAMHVAVGLVLIAGLAWAAAPGWRPFASARA